MVIAFASGKGGTGKTTVAVNLARVWESSHRKVRLLDCDVEAPNARLFLHPTITERIPVTVRVPVLDKAACDNCGECGRLCQYGAIVCLNEEVLIYPELCRSCGGCVLICEKKALSETAREIGIVEMGNANGIAFAEGRLNVGEAMGVPVIQELRQHTGDADILLLDAPPGSSCPMLATVKGSDYVCLVTEPTPFGLNDLRMAVDALRELGLRIGVVINRADIGDSRVRNYCTVEHLPILAEIANDRKVAEAYSRGQIAIDAIPELRATFESLATEIEEQVCKHAN